MILKIISRHRLWLVAASMLPAFPCAAETVHLLGFVDELCASETYCFDLDVKSEFVALVGERVRVRFADVKAIYDPENYELTLVQQNIVPGSHLRMLISVDAGHGPGEYRASFIWIGD